LSQFIKTENKSHLTFFKPTFNQVIWEKSIKGLDGLKEKEKFFFEIKNLSL